METAPLVHIRRGVRWRWLGLADVWEYRGLLLGLGIRDVKLRYRQTLLGVAWVLLQPLLSASILTVVFGLIAGLPGPEGVPYFAFAYIGQMAWMLFSQTVVRASNSMAGGSAYVTKIYFPRAILPLATVFGVLLDFLIGFMVAVPMVMLYGWRPMHLLTVGLSSMLLVLSATGIGLIMAALSVRFRDVLMVLPFIVQVGLYASPVAYGLEATRQSLAIYSGPYFDIYMLNPLASLIEAFRWGLLGRGLFLPDHFVYAADAVVLSIAGLTVFQASERTFADVI